MKCVHSSFTGMEIVISFESQFMEYGNISRSPHVIFLVISFVIYVFVLGLLITLHVLLRDLTPSPSTEVVILLYELQACSYGFLCMLSW